MFFWHDDLANALRFHLISEVDDFKTKNHDVMKEIVTSLVTDLNVIITESNVNNI